MFRELVIAFLGGSKDSPKAAGKTPEQKYCMLCRAAKKNTDCSKCDFKNS